MLTVIERLKASKQILIRSSVAPYPNRRDDESTGSVLVRHSLDNVLGLMCLTSSSTLLLKHLEKLLSGRSPGLQIFTYGILDLVRY